MDRMAPPGIGSANPPATRPPTASDLTPEELEQLRAQGWNIADDGALTPPASPPPAPVGGSSSFDYDAGGFGSAPGALPATSPAGAPSPPLPGPSALGAEPDTLNGPAGPVPNAPIAFAPQGNPMGDALPDPFEAPDVTPPLQAQPGPDLKAASQSYTGEPPPNDIGYRARAQGGGGYGGRIGRGMNRTAPTNRRRR